MARTTVERVKDVLRLGTEGGDYNNVANPNLSPFITAANAITTRLVTLSTAEGETISAANAEIIERWVAAHCYTISDRKYTRRKTGKAEGEFEERSYLEVPKALDPIGALEALIEGAVIHFQWGGKNPPTQVEFEDR